eukprot:scaffold2547_cov63-Phaeocystis_antarctica.AAC.1
MAKACRVVLSRVKSRGYIYQGLHLPWASLTTGHTYYGSGLLGAFAHARGVITSTRSAPRARHGARVFAAPPPAAG